MINVIACSILSTVLILIVIGIVHAVVVPDASRFNTSPVNVDVAIFDLQNGQIVQQQHQISSQAANSIDYDRYVVCLSNGYASNREWQCLIKHWPTETDQRIRFILPSYIGMGQSRIPPNFSFTTQEHVEQLDLAIQYYVPSAAIKSSEHLHLVGICTGGIFALELAARMQPKTLTLISTPYFDSPETAWDAGRKYAAWYRQIWRLHLFYYAFVRQQWILAPLARAKERACYPHLPFIYDCVMDGHPSTFAPTIENVMSVHRPQVSAKCVGTSETCTLVIRGESDTALCNAEHQKQLIADTNATSCIVKARKGANHFIAWNYTKQVLSKVAEFQGQ